MLENSKSREKKINGLNWQEKYTRDRTIRFSGNQNNVGNAGLTGLTLIFQSIRLYN